MDTTDPASLEKTYTVDEDDTGQELRATVTYTDRWDADNMGAPNTVESDPSAAVVDTRELAPPRFRSGAEQTIDEGPGGRDTNEGITATDRDGEVPIFGIEDGPHSDLFEIIPSGETTTATIQGNDYTEYTARLAATQALDFETLETNPLTITIRLSDGKGIEGTEVVYDDMVDVTYDVTIEVTNVDEPGVITLTPEEAPEPGVEITAELDDPDGNVSGESWQWQRSEDAEADTPVWADITGETSNTYTPSATDDVISGGVHDGKEYYLRVKATYTDGQGSGKTAYSTPERMGTTNTPPTFPTTETGSRSVDENSSVNTNIGAPVAANDSESNPLTYILEGEDADHFQIVSSTGQLRVRETLDFEERSSYAVTVNVHDRKDSNGRSSTRIDATQDVTITVTNVEEAGVVSLSSATNKVQVGVPVTAADDEGNYLRVTATYTDGEASGKSAEKETARVAAAPPTNAAPVFPDAEDGKREVAENSGEGTLVGEPVTATDLRGGTLSYSMTGSDSDAFTLNSATGQLSVAQNADLDYEKKRAYRFTLRVSDRQNQDGIDDTAIDDSISVTVELTNENEAPVVTGTEDRTYPENGLGSIGTYTARDPERDPVTWPVERTDAEGTDADDFFITSSGTLYFSEPPDYEIPGDDGMNNIYNIT